MMMRKMFFAGALSLTGMWSAAYGQFGAPPAIPGAPVAANAAATSAATSAAQNPNTLWSFLGLSKPQIKECIQKKCNTPFGQFMSKATTPLTMFTGGIIPPLCPPIPTAAELADQGVVGEAAKIKAEEANAKARKAAVRYLGTVDCGRFPDAEGALIKALRTDTNECVRYEAALALGNGCCCTKTTMEALSISAACSDRDGNPREYSDRVRAAAVSALQNCLSCFVDPNPPKVERPVEGGPVEGTGAEPEKIQAKPEATAKNDKAESKTPPARPTGAAYYAKINQVPRQMIVDEARRVVDNFNQVASAQVVLSRHTSLVTVINSSMEDRSIMDNPSQSMRADMVMTRPNTLWDVLTQQSSPVETGLPVREIVVKNTNEPPTVIVQNEPMPMTPPMNVIKNDSLPPMPMNTMRNEPPVITRTEPPTMNMAKSEPVPSLSIPNTEFKPMPATVNPNTVKTDIPKVIVPRENHISAKGSYGEQQVIRPKTPAELASMPRTTNFDRSTPAQLPPAVVQDSPKPMMMQEPSKPMIVQQPSQPVIVPEPTKPIVVQPTKPITSMQDVPKPMPVEMPKKVIVQEPAKPIIVPPTNKIETMKPVESSKASNSPLAQRAVTVFTEPHPAAVRESIADTLAANDVNGNNELVNALVKQAGSNDAESARKAAIRALVRCQVNRPDVLNSLDKLTEDASPAIRMEAAIATARLRVSDSK